MKKRLTLHELAEHWQCSDRHIIRLVEAKRLAAIDLGLAAKRKLVFDPLEVERFERENSPKPVKAIKKPRNIPNFV